MHSVEVIKITLPVPPATHHLQRIERADEEGGCLSSGGWQVFRVPFPASWKTS